ncbi:efflux RND transporter periplasmic adaptor subunit [Sodalis sp. RH21]|uniref:efflux RND transporter periplasmic adaptor subunit n=1 Tax=unclassified Sodalis (in: enterobacteria) TaxID=2636512 RepID=UPI0039B4E3BA
MKSETLALRSRQLIRILVTLVVTLAAIWAVLQLWDHYELAPWTRDGRVRANVVAIAPDVSGLVTDVAIHDNQRVAAGELLFVVDRTRYELAVRQAEVALNSQRIAIAQAQREDKRNAQLGTLIPQEERERTRTQLDQAQNGLAQAEVALDSARLNLQRAQVRSPVDGMVTNLDLRQGSYATTGKPVLALVDTGSFYVEGYFEETKLPRIHLGDPVRVIPMGGNGPFTGTVESIAAGIAERDRLTGDNLLPSVNPTFNWVRLAQRVPVRVKIGVLARDQRLVAGQTVTVEVTASATGLVATKPARQEP